MSDLVNMLTTTYSRQNPGITFDVVVSGEEAAARSVLNDHRSYLITDYLDDYLSDTLALWAAPIGQDGIALIAHPDIGVADLSSEQVREIYGGELDNWSEIGGTQVAIVAFTRESGAGIQDALIHQLLGSKQVGSNVRIAPSDAAMRFAVERTTGAIGYMPISLLDDREHALSLDGVPPTLDTVYAQQYPLRTILYVAGAHEPDADDAVGQHFRAFIGWMQSPDGQALIARYAAPLVRG